MASIQLDLPDSVLLATGQSPDEAEGRRITPTPVHLRLGNAQVSFQRETAARRAWRVDLEWLSGADWTASPSEAPR